jgi:hypothetical protein
MTKHDDGGPAFPHHVIHDSDPGGYESTYATADAAADAAAYAAYAAREAAHAARAAHATTYAAAYAAHAAEATLKQCAKIVRKHYPQPPTMNGDDQ